MTDGPQYPYLITKPRFNAPRDDIDAFYDERSDTLLLLVGGHRVTLLSKDAWRLLDTIERELHGPSLVEDHKGD